jgi:protein SCO1/2
VDHRIDGEGRHARRIVLPAVLLVAVAAAAFVAARAVGGGRPVLVGTDLGKMAAPDFTLTDQRGATVRLADLRGRAVVLTFIYTRCPDVCPLTAENLRAADALLSKRDRNRVELLAVTVDPARDTPAALQAFSAEHRLADNPCWHALRGERAALLPIWHAYGIDPGAMLAMATPAGVAAFAHTDAIYLIDPRGRERVLLHSNTAPPVLAKDLESVLG